LRQAAAGRFATDITVMAAGATMVSLPVIIIYVIFQRHFIRGLVSGALKA
jgi:raffinose/stachyose/melibiose transport system permease protein